MLTDTAPRLTTGDVARHFGVPRWAVRRLYESGQLPPAERLGRYRVIRKIDLPTIEAALVAAGHLAGRGASCTS